jgi:phosphate starvation-inducible protein PhoH
MPSFKVIEFEVEDIVRSDLVKEYILARLRYEEQYA